MAAAYLWLRISLIRRRSGLLCIEACDAREERRALIHFSKIGPTKYAPVIAVQEDREPFSAYKIAIRCEM